MAGQLSRKASLSTVIVPIVAKSGVRSLSYCRAWRILTFPLFVCAIVSLPSMSSDLQAATSAALVIGISQYEDEDINDLKWADSDAEEMAVILRDWGGFNKRCIKVLLNKKATKRGIERAFERLIEDCSQSNYVDEVLIYYSGHAVTAGPSGEYQFAGGFAQPREFLVPHDASLRQRYRSGDRWINDTFLKKEWFAHRLSELRSGKVAVIIDACHSGMPDFNDLMSRYLGYANYTRLGSSDSSISKAVEIVYTDPAPKQDLRGKVITMLSASKEDEKAREFDALGHGALTYAILETIDGFRASVKGADRYGQLSFETLFEGVRNAFYNNKINGKRLNQFHVPAIHTTADRGSLGEIPFLQIRGERVEPSPPAPGYLIVRSNPPDILVEVDGRQRSPDASGRYTLAPGYHRVAVRVRGSTYRHIERVRTESHKTARLNLNLRGDLLVKTILLDRPSQTGPKVDVYLNNRYFGKLNNQKLTNIIAGTHILRVSYEGKSLTKEISVRPDSPLRFVLEIERREAPTRKKKSKVPTWN